jgi:glycosidase
MQRAMVEIERFLATCAGLTSGSLVDELLAPVGAHPDSLAAQLVFLRQAWGSQLGAELWRVQSALDLIEEESAPRWSGDGAPPVETPGLPADAEKNYAVDREWMPRLVLAAKNTLVWLQQMSSAYGRHISRLDQIPDEEMALLAGRGVTGLWLIGLWERSPASSEIKRRRGNPEAAASAYSLRAYRIAEELGGEEALATLRQRAAAHGIRLAADMVPNHMGIDSDWVLDHPERFVGVGEPPYPAYSFNGADLSPREDTGIFLEDHYYDGSDAAVVFKRVDHRSGEERFIYHGNDGTSTPWNDTAQLDYLNPDVREAVIQTILDVARQFPVIRFDAAMTLAKRHYHRLWHPQPGDAGAVPSRSEHSMSRAEIDEVMPREFWREVVDRVAEELPDTLLLAEAFWLMEGYFVRTLGLHRVYNSAFMHLMRDQETGKFRDLLKETLAFDPEILRRYVNFMSNPDEESAADQFDVGDRYFGVCTVLATLPGLPMLAHGQWDGLREKYGMEYRRSYRQEIPSQEVISRHDRQIAPLFRQRALYAGVDGFRLFELVDDSGSVQEDVLAYSNSHAGQTGLVVFNNSPGHVVGRLSRSAPFRATPDADQLETRTVQCALSLATDPGVVNILRDRIRSVGLLVAGGDSNSGVRLDLAPYAALVFEEFSVVDDELGQWRKLAARLGGRPVGDPERELALLRLEPVLASVWPLAEVLCNAGPGISKRSLDHSGEEFVAAASEAMRAADSEFRGYVAGPPFSTGRFSSSGTGGKVPASPLWSDLARSLELARRARPGAGGWSLGGHLAQRPVLRCALVLRPLISAIQGHGGSQLPERSVVDACVVGAPLEGGARTDLSAMLRLALRERWFESQTPPGISELTALVEGWLDDRDGRDLLGLHQSGGIEWVVRERFEDRIPASRVGSGPDRHLGCRRGRRAKKRPSTKSDGNWRRAAWRRSQRAPDTVQRKSLMSFGAGAQLCPPCLRRSTRASVWLRQELQNADRSCALFVCGVRKPPSCAWLDGSQQTCPGAESRLSRKAEESVVVGGVDEGERRPVLTGPE